MHVAPAPTAPFNAASHHSAAIACLNCHRQLLGPFCHHCGQSAHTPSRITLTHLLHEVPHVIWHVDHGIFYNLRELLTRPGLSIQRYMAGERKKFFNPLSMLILVGGVSAFLFAKLHIVPFNTDQPGLSRRVLQTQHWMMEFIQRYQGWLSILFLPIEAAVATPLLRRATGYTWAEQLVAAALMSGAIAALNLVFIPALAYWSGQPPVTTISTLMTLVLVSYKAWSYERLQAEMPTPSPATRRWARAILVSAGQYLGIILMTAVALVLTVVLTR